MGAANWRQLAPDGPSLFPLSTALIESITASGLGIWASNPDLGCKLLQICNFTYFLNEAVITVVIATVVALRSSLSLIPNCRIVPTDQQSVSLGNIITNSSLAITTIPNLNL